MHQLETLAIFSQRTSESLSIYLYVCIYIITFCMLSTVGPEDEIPLKEAESAEQLADNNSTVMYGGKQLESGLDPESDALDLSNCPHRIIHVTPFHAKADLKHDTVVENQGSEQLQASEAPVVSEPPTDATSLQVEAEDDRDEPNSVPSDPNTEPCLPPLSPTSADSVLLSTLTNAGESRLLMIYLSIAMYSLVTVSVYTCEEH